MKTKQASETCETAGSQETTVSQASHFASFDALLEGFQVIDFEWRYLYINDSAAVHNKRPAEELLGRKYMEMWPGIETTEVFRIIKDTLENRKPHRMENRFVYPDGAVAWFNLSIQPIPEGVFILSVDITQRKRAQKELQEKEQRFRSVFESANVGKSITSLSGNIEVNQAFCDMLGYSKEELKNKHWKAITPPEDYESIQKKLDGLLDGSHSTQRFTKRYIHKNGSYVYCDLSVALHLDAEGEPAYLITTIIDITEQVAAKEALQRQEHLLRLFIEYSPAAIAMFDKDMRYIVASKRYNTDFGLGDIDLTGKSHYEVFPHLPERWKEVYRECLNGSVHKQSEEPYPQSNGKTDWLRWEVRPWHDRNNEIGGIIIFSELITDLIQTREKAEESDRLKSIFLANMSHEIRTPLNAIVGFSGLMLEEEKTPDPDQYPYLAMIKDAGHRLMSIVNDIIDISKLEAGQLKFKIEPQPLFPMIESSFHEFAQNAFDTDKKDIKLSMNLPEELRGCHVYTDRVRFQQILGNFISNAIKYTNQGSIIIGAEPLSTGMPNQLRIYVSDTGRGIPNNKKHLVFKRFRQVEEDQYHEGSGLGLSISKGLANRMGGDIGFSSTPGKGSTFYFTCNQCQADKKTDSPAIETEKSSFEYRQHYSICIAEDDEYSYLYLAKALKPSGARISRAKDGEALMRMLRQQAPDLILLDINMPKKNGMDCLKEIRQQKIPTKVIVQSGYAQADERTRFMAAGSDAFVAKPIDKQKLIKTINKLLTS